MCGVGWMVDMSEYLDGQKKWKVVQTLPRQGSGRGKQGTRSDTLWVRSDQTDVVQYLLLSRAMQREVRTNVHRG